MSDKSCRVNQNADFILNNIFLRKLCRLRDNVVKCCRAGQVTDDNMVHVHCVVDTYGYSHTLRICSNFCFFMATVVARTRFSLRYTCITCLV